MITRRMPVLDMTVIYDLAIVALRILMPVYAIIIVYQCYAAMRRRRRPEKPLVTLYNTVTGLKLPVIFWENSIGRSRASDIVVDDPAVKGNGAALDGVEARNHAQQRRLAAAGGAEQREELALPDVQIQVGDDDVLPIFLDDVLKMNPYAHIR